MVPLRSVRLCCNIFLQMICQLWNSPSENVINSEALEQRLPFGATHAHMPSAIIVSKFCLKWFHCGLYPCAVIFSHTCSARCGTLFLRMSLIVTFWSSKIFILLGESMSLGLASLALSWFHSTVHTSFRSKGLIMFCKSLCLWIDYFFQVTY